MFARRCTDKLRDLKCNNIKILASYIKEAVDGNDKMSGRWREAEPRKMQLQLLVPVDRSGREWSSNVKTTEWIGVNQLTLEGMCQTTCVELVLSQHYFGLADGWVIDQRATCLLELLNELKERKLVGITFTGIGVWDTETVKMFHFALTMTEGLRLTAIKQSLLGGVYSTFLAIVQCSTPNIRSLEIESDEFAFEEIYHQRMLWNAIGHCTALERLELNIVGGTTMHLLGIFCDQIDSLPNLKEIKLGPNCYEGLVGDEKLMTKFLSRVSRKIDRLEVTGGPKCLPSTSDFEHYWMARNKIKKIDFETFQTICCNGECRLKELKLNWMWLSCVPLDYGFQMVAENSSMENLELKKCIHPLGPTRMQVYDVPTVLCNISEMFVGLKHLDLSQCCIAAVEPLYPMFVGEGRKLETLWLEGNCIQYPEMEGFMRMLQQLDKEGKIYSLRAVNLSANPFDWDCRYADEYEKTINGSCRLAEVVIESWERSRSKKVYERTTGRCCINQFWRGDAELVELGGKNRLPLSFWPVILRRSQTMRYLKEVGYGDGVNLRGGCYLASTERTIENDRLNVLYYMVRNVLSEKLANNGGARGWIEIQGDRRLRRRLFW